MRAPLGRRRPAVDQDPAGGRRCGARCGRRRTDHPPPAAPQSPQGLGHGKAGRYRQQAALNGHRDGRALQQPALAAATAAASSHSSSHARRVSRSQADQGEAVPTRTRAARVAVDPGSSRWRLQPTTLYRGRGNQRRPTTNGTYRQIHHPRDGNMERCVLRLMAARGLSGDTVECPGNSMQHAAWVADWTTSLVAEKAAAARWKERHGRHL
jgi:hypothetical protein